jgi:hypothetical protein
MAGSHQRVVVAVGLGVLVVIAGLFALYLAPKGASPTEQTSSVSRTTSTPITPVKTTPTPIILVGAGTTQSLPYKGGAPVCYDIPFSLSSNGTLNGGLKATGLINWYILSQAGKQPISGSIISGAITQAVPLGPWVLEFCNQQKSSLNLTITQSFVVTQA